MSKTTYKVTITKIEHDVPYTDEVWHQLVDEPDENHKEIYGYVSIERTKNIETQVFAQTLEEIDLPKVVLTINTPS